MVPVLYSGAGTRCLVGRVLNGVVAYFTVMMRKYGEKVSNSKSAAAVLK
jgi:hypothetical protein